ncbi:MAG: hypothetical protein AAB646_01935 [Patescibacteria group bacterium]
MLECVQNLKTHFLERPMVVPDRINNPEWQSVFMLARTTDDCYLKSLLGVEALADDHAHGPVAVSDGISTKGFHRNDVERVIRIKDGDKDVGEKWLGVFQLKDGRFVSVRGWCDQSGFG